MPKTGSEAARCDFANDPRFKKNADRVRNRAVLIPMLADVLRTRTVEEWVATLEPLGIPVGPINDLAQTFEHPQVKARGMRIDLPHPLSGAVPLVANPIKMSKTPTGASTAPPLLGQHTSEVLREHLSLSDSEIEALRAKGIL
jgi:crotonobetainyl-CoA:carnitine CoA-transferase CaiB-like acyl-CoA transferase